MSLDKAGGYLAQEIHLSEVTEGQRERARWTICANAEDSDEAELFMRMLGLL